MRNFAAVVLAVVVALVAMEFVADVAVGQEPCPGGVCYQPAQTVEAQRYAPPMVPAVPMFTPVYTDGRGNLWTVQNYRRGLFRRYSVWFPYQGGGR